MQCYSHCSVLSPDSKELVMPTGTLGKVAPTDEGKATVLRYKRKILLCIVA